jgi:hypothetical protein
MKYTLLPQEERKKRREARGGNWVGVNDQRPVDIE